MLYTKSLREQIYAHIKQEMNQGSLSKGSTINMNAMSARLGISKTPLRDALIQLESEGFVTIQPRKGIMVKELTLKELKESYEIIGSLEVSVMQSVFHQLDKTHIGKMKRLNRAQYKAFRNGDFESYYQLNLDFHGVFLELSSNDALKRILTLLKQRLYDFPRRTYLEQWEMQNLEEHERLVECIAGKALKGALNVLKEEHWAYGIHEKYIMQFYGL